MFFLDFGESMQVGSKYQHGQFHFLFQSCDWRFRSQANLLVGSEDEQSHIDKVFQNLALSRLVSATQAPGLWDLTLHFTSGITLETFSACSQEDADWTQWIFFVPGDLAWNKRATGAPTRKSIHEA